MSGLRCLVELDVVGLYMSHDELVKQRKATSYYDKFSGVYDVLSPKSYYHKARLQAIRELRSNKGSSVLNVPVGTRQNI